MDHTPLSVEYERLLMEKTAKLADLQSQKPGHKHYKRSLKAFLEADAQLQRVLMQRIEQEPRHFAPARSTPDPKA
jgi:predicted component of type VI protein secretion system